jgi:murein L,D-transpeptidase YcbB/YkuD
VRLALLTAVVMNVAATAVALAQPNQQLRVLADSGVLSDLRWPNFTRLQPDVATFYESSGYQFAWVRAGEATPQALAIIHTLESAALKGLDAEDYDGSRWNDRLPQVRTDAGAIRFDIALTVSAMRYISDVSSGKVNPEVFSFGLRFDQKKCDLPATLRELTNAHDVAGGAVVRESGEVFFFDDIYGHDASLERVLEHGHRHSGWQPTSAASGLHPRG